MNKQYLDNLYNRLQDGEVLSKTEIKLISAYVKMNDYEFDWLGFDEISELNYKELVCLMLKAEVDEIYITGEWSNQFANWFEMQEVGLEMVGIREIDNPTYVYHVKKRGISWDKPTQYVLVFRLNK
jgi:hypothetical protein